MFKKKNAVLLLAMTLALAACGGGGSGSGGGSDNGSGNGNGNGGGSGNAATPTSGKAVDGYLKGSTVFCDANKNGVADAGEATVQTIAGGVFTFPAGCSSTVVVTGGTDETTGYAFKGTLKAPAGSTVVTPLTSLLADTGMTAAQLATALGLPAGTDVTKIDPAAPGNEAVMKTTLAVQQIIQQLAKSLGGPSGSTDISDIYSNVAAEVAKALLAPGAVPLFNGGVVNSAMLSAATQGAFASANISAEDLAAAVAQIGRESAQFLNASNADLASLSSKLQNPAAAPIDTAAVAAAKEAAAKAIAEAEAALAAAKEAADIAAAEAALAAAKEAAAKAIAAAEAAAAAAKEAVARANYLALQSDSLTFNGTTVSYASLSSLAGATISTPTTIGLNFKITGTPAINTVAKLALELVEVDGDHRVLQLMIDKVNIKNVAGQLSIVPDANAKVYVYGHTANGTDINLTLNDLTFKPLTVTDNSLTLNYASMVNKVLASVDNTTKTTAQKFTSIVGDFKIKLAVDGLTIRKLDGLSVLPSSTITVTGTDNSVDGGSVAGTLHIH